MRTNNDPSLLISLENWFEDYPHPQDWLSLVFGPGSTRAPLGWEDQQFYDLVQQADALPLDEAIPLYQQADARLRGPGAGGVLPSRGELGSREAECTGLRHLPDERGRYRLPDGEDLQDGVLDIADTGKRLGAPWRGSF